MSYTPNHLGHVNIYVRNAEDAHNWYEDILGLHTYDFVPGRAAFMSANLDESHEIALMEVGADAAGPEAGRVGLNHMAWRMNNLEDLEEFYYRLKERDVSMGIGDHGISLGIYFQDPDGNGIEVYYELPRDQWHRQHDLFLHGDTPKGRLPGPWNEILEKQKAAAASR
jgi:catechol-2,3-dioxygenase